MSLNSTETEIKLPLTPEKNVQQAWLPSIGFQLKKERTLEQNTLFDTYPPGLRPRGELLRIRECGSESILTFKGRATAGKYKVREELEVPFRDAATMAAIFERLGYFPGFRYEKYRTEYTDGHGILTIDETPIGSFLELEGTAQWIDEKAAALGYKESDYITSSYGALYAEHCSKAGIPPGDMVFRESPESTSIKSS